MGAGVVVAVGAGVATGPRSVIEATGAGQARQRDGLDGAAGRDVNRHLDGLTGHEGHGDAVQLGGRGHGDHAEQGGRAERDDQLASSHSMMGVPLPAVHRAPGPRTCRTVLRALDGFKLSNAP